MIGSVAHRAVLAARWWYDDHRQPVDRARVACGGARTAALCCRPTGPLRVDRGAGLQREPLRAAARSPRRRRAGQSEPESLPGSGGDRTPIEHCPSGGSGRRSGRGRSGQRRCAAADHRVRLRPRRRGGLRVAFVRGLPDPGRVGRGACGGRAAAGRRRPRPRRHGRRHLRPHQAGHPLFAQQPDRGVDRVRGAGRLPGPGAVAGARGDRRGLCRIRHRSGHHRCGGGGVGISECLCAPDILQGARPGGSSRRLRGGAADAGRRTAQRRPAVRGQHAGPAGGGGVHRGGRRDARAGARCDGRADPGHRRSREAGLVVAGQPGQLRLAAHYRRGSGPNCRPFAAADILVRVFRSDGIRITLAGPAENDRVLAVLRDLSAAGLAR